MDAATLALHVSILPPEWLSEVVVAMKHKRPVPVIPYYVHGLPPRTFWKISGSIPRSQAGSFVEQLYSITSERGGASFFYPDIGRGRTRCRYEWHAPLGKEQYGLRIGIVVEVSASDISELEAYVTRSTVFDDMTRPMEPLTEPIIESAQKSVVETLNDAVRRQQPQEQKAWVAVYHVEVPYVHGFAERFQTSDGRLTLLPTRILKDRHRRISASLIHVQASAGELARAQAFRDITVACALFTLASAQRYETTTLNWPRTRPAIRFVPSNGSFKEDRLYCGQRKWPKPEEMSSGVTARCEWIWSAFSKLTEADRQAFLAPLFAYYTATVRTRDFETLSVVGYTAALSALAAQRRAKCDGTLTCSKCGVLQFRHDLAGEVRAIVDTVAEVCNISDDGHLRELRTMIQRVYSKQRSAYVHAAHLRHEEYGQGDGFPGGMPTNDALVQEQYEYALDLSSISSITRRTLLEWIAARASSPLDNPLFFVDPNCITMKAAHSGRFTFPETAVIRLLPPANSAVQNADLE